MGATFGGAITGKMKKKPLKATDGGQDNFREVMFGTAEDTASRKKKQDSLFTPIESFSPVTYFGN